MRGDKLIIFCAIWANTCCRARAMPNNPWRMAPRDGAVQEETLRERIACPGDSEKPSRIIKTRSRSGQDCALHLGAGKLGDLASSSRVPGAKGKSLNGCGPCKKNRPGKVPTQSFCSFVILCLFGRSCRCSGNSFAGNCFFHCSSCHTELLRKHCLGCLKEKPNRNHTFGGFSPDHPTLKAA